MGDVNTIVHENAHQWYGDSVAVDTWKDICLNERHSRAGSAGERDLSVRPRPAPADAGGDDRRSDFPRPPFGRC
ncbi:M1 family aminopeptidase [Streptomyces sp. AA4]|uniref:M1 family aminopeptidase n=1 Tax=Streptomyces sp. AA4 TaxID=591158 RepID=UPI00336AE3FA